MAPDVFLSHNSRDGPLTRLVAADLGVCGLDVWVDTDHVSPGASFVKRLNSALESTGAFAVLLSNGALRSRWVGLELDAAVALHVERARPAIFVVLLPGFDPDRRPALVRPHPPTYLLDPAQYDSQLRLLAKAVAQSVGGTLSAEGCRLEVTAERAARLAAVGCSAETHDWAVRYLVGRTTTIPPTERYWAYVALGRVGGPEATAALLSGLTDSDALARKGAEEGLALRGSS